MSGLQLPKVMNLDGMVPNEAILPQQFYAGPHTSGEHRLLVALLEDAIDCLFKGAVCLSRKQGIDLYTKARRWFAAEPGWEFPLSFSFVCDALRLPQDRLRQRLQQDLTLIHAGLPRQQERGRRAGKPRVSSGVYTPRQRAA